RAITTDWRQRRRAIATAALIEPSIRLPTTTTTCGGRTARWTCLGSVVSATTGSPATSSIAAAIASPRTSRLAWTRTRTFLAARPGRIRDRRAVSQRRDAGRLGPGRSIARIQPGGVDHAQPGTPHADLTRVRRQRPDPRRVHLPRC